MKTTILLLLAVISFTTACSTSPTIPNLTEGVKETISIDERLMEECPEVTNLEANVRPSDVLAQHGEDVKVIKCLQEKNAGLVKVLKKAANLE